jgi:hypothetical protein
VAPAPRWPHRHAVAPPVATGRYGGGMRADGPQAFRWRLDGPHPFPLTRALLLGARTHAAVLRTATR